MIRPLWLPNGARLHLARWAGPGRWRVLCSRLQDCEIAEDLEWPWLREDDSPGWSDAPGGRAVLGGWLGDPDLPDWPVCAWCSRRWRYEGDLIAELIARVA